MSVIWNGLPLTEKDVEFLKSVRVATDHGHEAHVRDYGRRRAPKRDWSDYLMWVSALGIIAVCSVLIYTEYFQ
jgi:hypothetical protein